MGERFSDRHPIRAQYGIGHEDILIGPVERSGQRGACQRRTVVPGTEMRSHDVVQAVMTNGLQDGGCL